MMQPVTIYTKSWCPYCHSAKDLLVKKGVAFEEIDVSEGGAKQAAMAERALKVDARNPTYLDTAGWAHLTQGNNVDRALQYLRDARLRSPNDGEIRYHLAAALARSQRTAEARTELDAALQMPRTLQSADDARKLLASLK